MKYVLASVCQLIHFILSESQCSVLNVEGLEIEMLTISSDFNISGRVVPLKRILEKIFSHTANVINIY